MATLYSSYGYSYDGDSSDLTYSDYVSAGSSGGSFYGSGGFNVSSGITGYGHTDSYGDIDFCPLYVNSSGTYDIVTTISSGIAGIYDYTVGGWVMGSGYNNYTTGLYLDSWHTYDIGVMGFVSGESYSLAVSNGTTTPIGSTYSSALGMYASDISWGGDMGTVYPTYGSSTAYSGYTDWYADDDYSSVMNYTSDTYYAYTTGNVNLQFFDGTLNQWVGTGGYDYASAYLEASHDNYLIAVGYTTNQSYNVTVY